MSNIKTYRNDIDGIRAIAVLSVVAYHFGLPLSGGFVGVDIFFVISGYLIGSHIYEAANAGNFSYVNFYAKRAKRILPALVAVLIVVAVVMLLIGTPTEFRDFGRDAVASLSSVSNVSLYKSIDYFRPTAEFNPLLMTWSLGVEEQFYIVAPIVLAVLVKFPEKRRFPILFGLTALSFLFGVWKLRHDVQAAFYLLPPRAWELGAGVLLAVWLAHHSTWDGRRGAKLNEGLAFVGLALLIAPIVLYSVRTPFPGLAAVPPVLGSFLLLKTHGSFVNSRILSNRFTRFFGLTSYSLYLWHWPVISVTRLMLEKEPSLMLRLMLLAVSVVLAWLSYKYVETPFRRTRSSDAKSLRRYGFAIVAMTLITGSAFLMHGYPERWPQEFAGFEAASSEPHDRCLAGYGQTKPDASVECLGAQSDAAMVALVGDSHASAMAPGIKTLARQGGLGFEELTKSSCPLLQGVSRRMTSYPKHFEECAAFNEAVMNDLVNDARVKTVVIGGFWRIGLSEEGPYTSLTGGLLTRGASLEEGLGSAVDHLRTAGKRVVLMRDVPFIEFVPIRRKASCSNPIRAFLNGVAAGSGECEVAPLQDVMNDSLATNLIRNVSKKTGATFLDPTASLCSKSGCRFAAGSQMLYLDQQHLSSAGALAVVASDEFTLSVVP